uniref:Transmembrane protein n=1 Tax=Cacopsylla melanoneura TaxID=428564 RepID=A0A8D8QMM0_9HEMI
MVESQGTRVIHSRSFCRLNNHVGTSMQVMVLMVMMYQVCILFGVHSMYSLSPRLDRLAFESFGLNLMFSVSSVYIVVFGIIHWPFGVIRAQVGTVVFADAFPKDFRCMHARSGYVHVVIQVVDDSIYIVLVFKVIQFDLFQLVVNMLFDVQISIDWLLGLLIVEGDSLVYFGNVVDDTLLIDKARDPLFNIGHFDDLTIDNGDTFVHSR